MNVAFSYGVRGNAMILDRVKFSISLTRKSNLISMSDQNLLAVDKFHLHHEFDVRSQ